MLSTPLIGFHRSAGARLVDFAGWEMPVVYSSITDEHNWTRRHGSFFDVSHMGRVEFNGPDAERLLQKLNTRNVGDMKPGLSRYSHMCREDGGILDDVIVSRLEDRFLVVCNASNREKLLGWWERQRVGHDVNIVDRTLETAMIAIQGPEVLETLGRLLPVSLQDLKRYHFKAGNLIGNDYLIARSGYTGEDGVEIICKAELAVAAVQMLVGSSREIGREIKPAGLGARDTLRLEAGMPLYGHELTEDWDSLTAGQAWCVDLTKDFIGAARLREIAAAGPARKMVGLELEGKRIARQDAPVVAQQPVGVVTSGTLSPTLQKSIAMGLVDADQAGVGHRLKIDLRGALVDAQVVKLPFYKRG